MRYYKRASHQCASGSYLASCGRPHCNGYFFLQQGCTQWAIVIAELIQHSLLLYTCRHALEYCSPEHNEDLGKIQMLQ